MSNQHVTKVDENEEGKFVPSCTCKWKGDARGIRKLAQKAAEMHRARAKVDTL
jgi:hypothetical protein